MEDDWSSGYSGYSFDTPMFMSSLAQEAQGEWQKVNPKKAARQSNCSAHAACQGHIPKGRYDVLSDCNYNPFFSDFDDDFDLPLMMTRSEEGDVPPGIASPGGAVFVNEAGTARAPEPNINGELDEKNMRADEFQRSMEKYHHQHKARISKNIPSTFVKVYPLENRGDSDHRGEKECPRASQNGDDFLVQEQGTARTFHQHNAPKLLGTNGAGAIPAPPGNLKIEVPEPLPLEPRTPDPPAWLQPVGGESGKKLGQPPSLAPGLSAPQHHLMYTPP